MIITPADKRSVLFVMNTLDYKDEDYRQLNSRDCGQRPPVDPTQRFCNLSWKELNPFYDDKISWDLYSYLKPNHPVPGTF